MCNLPMALWVLGYYLLHPMFFWDTLQAAASALHMVSHCRLCRGVLFLGAFVTWWHIAMLRVTILKTCLLQQFRRALKIVTLLLNGLSKFWYLQHQEGTFNGEICLIHRFQRRYHVFPKHDGVLRISKKNSVIVDSVALLTQAPSKGTAPNHNPGPLKKHSLIQVRRNPVIQHI